jgi:hypothetical protein
MHFKLLCYSNLSFLGCLSSTKRLGSIVHTNVGIFNFFKNCQFWFLCLYVRIRLILELLKNKCLMKTILGIRFFPRKKNPIVRFRKLCRANTYHHTTYIIDIPYSHTHINI